MPFFRVEVFMNEIFKKESKILEVISEIYLNDIVSVDDKKQFYKIILKGGKYINLNDAEIIYCLVQASLYIGFVKILIGCI